ncbi:uncharacterized protein TM35_000791100 [Trypanosoma theileri]|uniref:Pre-mRNA-splicing factor SLU7 n=1 Tax=Trypanosoma theileri TaxID=67003 RepID=A0A1X0NEY6_9TRYP|nr:uncharacterized protein TM35_000791100 [Trypanosoma theileri]ORC82984.1 hypothetical protein TM35_000791100 [Trypanosoma theileri]
MLNKKKNDTAEEAGMTVRQRLRQKRELEEKRKFGLAPLAVDELTGQEISPNVPQLISQAPWYYGATGPTLDHQRQKHTDAMDTLQDQHDTAIVLGKATKYAAGACGNCGSNTHKTDQCYKPRKKIGAQFSGKVTGIDMQVRQAEKSYAQKRDRYATAAGVDLLQQQVQEDEDEDEEKADGDREKAGLGAKRPRLQDVFVARTATTGGSAEIKELPKHLQNLDNDGLLFDPKTGSMRGNPNAADPTRVFQGDLERYRSGDYYTYLEMQMRFLTGESSSFVDFKLDEQLQKQKALQKEPQGEQDQQKKKEGGITSSSNNVGDSEETARDRLVRSLYGESTLASVESSLRMKEALAGVVSAAAPPTTGTTSASINTTTAISSSSSVILPSTPSLSLASRHPRAGMATRNGHACVYGSYFDRNEFRWGYKCCRRLGKDAPSCQSSGATAMEEATSTSP